MPPSRQQRRICPYTSHHYHLHHLQRIHHLVSDSESTNSKRVKPASHYDKGHSSEQFAAPPWISCTGHLEEV
eukprot:CAMPEP_0196820558 /NCGR_PEP_ID=MMETSP1362-20130617/75860_1 /TAXON_ID=163516 /ORGANISM="Leptocylindrus danicus, Strain CCMP1856" /LENGTH=71 /DNA_ID=CAMNT_0042199489 /DNA_START=470 /DNA_END=685 /DNA_ORIENTATION=+